MADRLVVLREGEVQQVGTPEELYEKPTNWYVADFMGYRNLIDMQVSRVNDDGTVTVAGGGFSLVGSPQGAVKAGDKVRVAIRPEDFVVGAGASVPNATDVTVGVVEYLGREYVFDAGVAGGASVHIKDEQHPGAGSSLTIGVPTRRVLVYPSELTSYADELAAV